MCALYKRLGIDAGLTTAYHPQANGQVERKNQEVEAYLRLFIGKRQDDWVDLLPTAEFVINSQLNSATGHTPFELLYGYTPDCHGRCILSSLIFYFERHVTAGYFT